MEHVKEGFPSLERMREVNEKWDDLRHYMESKGWNELEIIGAKTTILFHEEMPIALKTIDALDKICRKKE